MLHHNNGIAYVAQRLERSDEPVVVARMKTDTGLVENIKYINKLRAHLRGKAYALSLATRQRDRRAVEREITETHIEQEAYACFHLLHNLARNGTLLVGERLVKFIQPLVESSYVH